MTIKLHISPKLSLPADAVTSTIVIYGGKGLGKCLGPEVPVLHFDGHVTRADGVSVGDQLMGPDSKPRNVISTTRGTGPMFTVLPTKGEPWRCNVGDEPDEDATCSHEVHEVEIPSAIAAACVDDALIEKLAAFDPVTENAKRHEADHDGFTCAKCGAALHIEAEYDPSALCHECTHAVLDALVAEVAEHRKHAKDATP